MAGRDDVAKRLDFLIGFLSESLGIPREEIDKDKTIPQLVGEDENRQIAVIMGLKMEYFFGPYPFRGKEEYTLADWAELASKSWARAHREQRRRGYVKSNDCRS